MRALTQPQIPNCLERVQGSQTATNALFSDSTSIDMGDPPSAMEPCPIEDLPQDGQRMFRGAPWLVWDRHSKTDSHGALGIDSSVSGCLELKNFEPDAIVPKTTVQTWRNSRKVSCLDSC